MKIIVVKWKVSDTRYKQLIKMAKAWGNKSISDYIKSMLKAKVGNISDEISEQ